jgi:hypothetical protein
LSRFLVSAQGNPGTPIEAANWLAALGVGLDRLGLVGAINRLACEVLPNGTVIARDARTGEGFVVQPMLHSESLVVAPRELDSEMILPADDDDDNAFADGEEGFSLLSGEGDRTEADEVDEAEEDDAEDDEDVDTDAGLVDGSELIISAGIASIIEDLSGAPSDVLAWEAALRLALARVPAEAAAALRIEEDGGLRYVSTAGPMAHKLLGARLHGLVGLAGFCADRRLNLVVVSPARDPRFYAEVDRTMGTQTRATLCVAVHDDVHSYGAIELMNPPRGAIFGRAHVEIVEIIARALAQRLSLRSPSP